MKTYVFTSEGMMHSDKYGTWVRLEDYVALNRDNEILKLELNRVDCKEDVLRGIIDKLTRELAK